MLVLELSRMWWTTGIQTQLAGARVSHPGVYSHYALPLHNLTPTLFSSCLCHVQIRAERDLTGVVFRYVFVAS